jgi:hypothetical protein
MQAETTQHEKWKEVSGGQHGNSLKKWASIHGPAGIGVCDSLTIFIERCVEQRAARVCFFRPLAVCLILLLLLVSDDSWKCFFFNIKLIFFK